MTKLAEHPTAAAAKDHFKRKFREKTSNQWSDRTNFRLVPGKYTMVERDYSANDEDEDDREKHSKDNRAEADRRGAQSELDDKVQELVRLICDVGQRTDQ